MTSTPLVANHSSLLRAAALTWFCVGLFLLTRGIDLVILEVDLSPVHIVTEKGMSPLFFQLSLFLGSTVEASLTYIILGLALGMLKAKTIFRRIVGKNVARIISMKQKQPIFAAFGRKDYITMACMMLLGILLRAFGLYDDLRGFILIAVGAALIQGSMLYVHSRQEYLRKA